MPTVTVRRSPKVDKKWQATFNVDGRVRHVNFGSKGYSDYTMHKDAARMHRYLTRHRRREAWGPSGKFTAGFWSRWFLWSKPSLEGARLATQRALGTGWRVQLRA
jgi:hypothetical protein